MIDGIFKYTSKAAALADLTDHVSSDVVIDWLMDHCIPDVKVWRDSQDVSTTGTSSDGSSFPIVTHTYLSGYFILISVPRPILSLSNNPALQIAIDRDTSSILKRNITLTLLQDLRFSPVFAGCSYPWGNW